MQETGIIILAAGSSSRLGRPKQLLSYEGKSLLERTKEEACKANLQPVVVVTGAYAEQVSVSLQEKQVTIVYNEHWQEGMTSGIIAGLSKLLLIKNNPHSVILSVCDQPFVSAELFLQLIKEKAETGKGIIACTYADTVGTPVLFGPTYFEALLQLKGEGGAKSLVKMYKDDVATIPFSQGSIDIDTAEDYRNLLNNGQ